MARKKGKKSKWNTLEDINAKYSYDSRSRGTMKSMPSNLFALAFCHGQDIVYPAAMFIEVTVLLVDKGIQVQYVPVN